MRAQLLVSMIALTVIPMILLQSFYTNYMINHIIQNRIELVHDYGKQIGEEMLTTGFLTGTTSDVIDGEVGQFAGMYNGRIIVTDASLNVLVDTYDSIEGKQLITPEVIKALQGEEISEYDKSADEVSLTYIVRDSDQRICGTILFFVSCEDLTVTYDNIVRTMTIVMAVFAVILVTLSIVITKRFMKPFRNMESSINRIAEGKFDDSVNLHGFSEIEDISVAYNTMLRRLKELENTRQEFVSNVSHELKTPLTSMKVLADSLNMQPDVPVELYREFMVDIAESIDRENQIITDLLSLVKMDKAAGDLHASDVNINELLEVIVKRLKPIADKRNIELIVEKYETIIARCDELKLTTAFTNLIENALKYNVAGGWVKVTMNMDEEYFYVKVADSGIGIPKEAQDKVFERFYRVDKARSRETGGTGLGLAITKQIIDMHNGTIKVHSVEDEGTTFTVRIPLKPEEEQ